MKINYKLGESKEVEFKREYSKTLLKTVSAYANYNDGLIVIGINDNGSAVGVSDVSYLKEQIENAINDAVLPNPYFEIETDIVDGKTVLIIKVYKSENTPYTYLGKAYKRIAITTREVDMHEYNELVLNGKNLTYDEIPINDDELDLSVFSNRLRKIMGISEVDKNVLVSLDLYKNGKYNIAAKLLSDNNNIGKITLLRYHKDVELIKDRIDLENMSILTQFDKCIDFYFKHVNKQEIIDGAFRKTIEEIPLVAYREAIANAICHRDYNKQSNVKVEIFDERIEITSPGGLPVGISYDDFIDGRISVPRNKVIAEIFYRLKLIEKIATGIRRIKSYYKEYDSKPEFQITANSVRVVLPNVLYKAEISLPEKEQEIIDLLNDEEFLAAREISTALGIKKTQTSKYLGDLLSKGLIIKIGNGRNVKYMLKRKQPR
ncbi:MAG: RNA-binding domain-containing protein [Clostridiaceae bacterium]